MTFTRIVAATSPYRTDRVRARAPRRLWRFVRLHDPGRGPARVMFLRNMPFEEEP